jgi:hypothetical protein
VPYLKSDQGLLTLVFTLKASQTWNWWPDYRKKICEYHPPLFWVAAKLWIRWNLFSSKEQKQSEQTMTIAQFINAAKNCNQSWQNLQKIAKISFKKLQRFAKKLQVDTKFAKSFKR